MPRQRIKLEIANIPAYTSELVPLRQNYEFLLGYGLLLADYHIDDYERLLGDAIDRLPGLIDGKAFADQMTRFIDADTLARTLREPRFADYLKSTVGQVLNSMAAHLAGTRNEAGHGFKM